MILSVYQVIQLTTTFLVMGTWVTVIALATQKRGGKLGGFLVGFPSTAALSFLFTGLFASTNAAVRATDSFPIFLSVIGFFLLSFGYLARKGFVFGIIFSTIIWFAISFLVVYSGIDDFGVSLAISLLVTACLYFVFRTALRPRKPPGGFEAKYTLPLLVFRFILGGGIVTLAVLMGEIGIPILSSMFASFPALSISTLVAIRTGNKTKGTRYAIGMTMSMLVSIMAMVVPYSLVVHYLFPVLGVWYGTLAAYAVAAAIGIPYYFRGEERLVPTFSIQNASI
jgi:hypothetical protein